MTVVPVRRYLVSCHADERTAAGIAFAARRSQERRPDRRHAKVRRRHGASTPSNWDGPVKAILEPARAASNNLDNKCVVPAALPFGLELMSFRDRRLTAELAESAVVLGGAEHRQNHLAAACRKVGTPFVCTTEYTLATREQIIATEEWNPLRRWRRAWWERSQERANVKSVRAAAGVQCNGLPTYHAYRNLNPRTMLYFDTRTTGEMMPDEERMENRLARLLQGEPLRLVFSGRLIAMKGADHLPPFAAELRRLGVPFTLGRLRSGRFGRRDAFRADAIRSLRGSAVSRQPRFQNAADAALARRVGSLHLPAPAGRSVVHVPGNAWRAACRSSAMPTKLGPDCWSWPAADGR